MLNFLKFRSSGFYPIQKTKIEPKKVNPAKILSMKKTSQEHDRTSEVASNSISPTLASPCLDLKSIHQSLSDVITDSEIPTLSDKSLKSFLEKYGFDWKDAIFLEDLCTFNHEDVIGNGDEDLKNNADLKNTKDTLVSFLDDLWEVIYDFVRNIEGDNIDQLLAELNQIKEDESSIQCLPIIQKILLGVKDSYLKLEELIHELSDYTLAKGFSKKSWHLFFIEKFVLDENDSCGSKFIYENEAYYLSTNLSGLKQGIIRIGKSKGSINYYTIEDINNYCKEHTYGLVITHNKNLLWRSLSYKRELDVGLSMKLGKNATLLGLDDIYQLSKVLPITITILPRYKNKKIDINEKRPDRFCDCINFKEAKLVQEYTLAHEKGYLLDFEDEEDFDIIAYITYERSESSNQFKKKAIEYCEKFELNLKEIKDKTYDSKEHREKILIAICTFMRSLGALHLFRDGNSRTLNIVFQSILYRENLPLSILDNINIFEGCDVPFIVEEAKKGIQRFQSMCTKSNN